MVVDTSAIVTILLDESEAGDMAAAIEAASVRLLSAANLVEASIVIEARKGEEGARDLESVDLPCGYRDCRRWGGTG